MPSTPQPLRVCQVVASINRDVGGTAVVVSRLAEAMARQGVACSLVTLDYPRVGLEMPTEGVRLVSLPADSLARRLRGFSPALGRQLDRAADEGFDVIHNHGLWMFPNLYARQTAVRNGTPLVISPHGMVDAWSLGRSRLRKFVFWHLFEKANLKAAKLFHATSEAEAVSLRALGLCQPIAVIPNGVDLPDLTTIPSREILERKFPELHGRQWLLFLSRLHPKKGVMELLRVWQQQSRRFSDWQLILAGPDLDGFGRRAREQANALGIAARVTFTGMLAGDEKACALGNAGLFVLPTHSENFGIVVAEALAHGLPAVTTTGAPWRELTEHRCGWWIDVGEAPLTVALNVALQLPPSDLRHMGRRGRALVQQRYSWSRVAEEMKTAYEWLLGRCDQPGWVLASDLHRPSV